MPLILSDSLCLNSLIPLNFDTPFTREAAINNRGNSSIEEGTKDFGHLIDLRELLLTTILPISSPAFFF